jgi:hypothetical protein
MYLQPDEILQGVACLEVVTPFEDIVFSLGYLRMKRWVAGDSVWRHSFFSRLPENEALSCKSFWSTWCFGRRKRYHWWGGETKKKRKENVEILASLPSASISEAEPSSIAGRGLDPSGFEMPRSCASNPVLRHVAYRQVSPYSCHGDAFRTCYGQWLSVTFRPG